MNIAALAGGVGGAKLADGLARVWQQPAPPSPLPDRERGDLTIIFGATNKKAKPWAGFASAGNF
jgi:hypothetical protein